MSANANYIPLFQLNYLHSLWENDYKHYVDSNEDEKVLSILKRWNQRNKTLTEVQSEADFVTQFFDKIWGYWGNGQREKELGYCRTAQYGISKAGQAGGKGAADLALGWFDLQGTPPVPQVLCEFKDIRSDLDAPQKRKGNDRTPVAQCFDYLKYAFDKTDSSSYIYPSWCIVTDMNEFRLYSRKVGASSCMKFVVNSDDNMGMVLVGSSDEEKFQRFIFSKIFSKDLLLSNSGKSELEKILEQQLTIEKDLEKSFYKEYQSFREFVYSEIVKANGDMNVTRGSLVRLTQRFLDRCIFLLFCEDMGSALDFPTHLLRDILIEKTKDRFFNPDGNGIWQDIKDLFNIMRDGGMFPPAYSINKFNGGLFEQYPELENLYIPNKVFCVQGQGESKEILSNNKASLLYFSYNYNFGRDSRKEGRTITLYALGRIFEQSITDLEYMEAEADNAQNIATVTKRKRDGVYYTPEIITQYIVKETLGSKLDDIKRQIGLVFAPDFSDEDIANYRGYLLGGKGLKKILNKALLNYVGMLDEYIDKLNSVKILDPSCGSGAFLIQTLHYLLNERKMIEKEKTKITGRHSLLDSEGLVRSILSNNIFGVDINPESVEITQLALWLYTAIPGKPLNNLSKNIICGNTLISLDFEMFYNKKYSHLTLFEDCSEEEKEKYNVFDWRLFFPAVFGDDVEDKGFDCIVGNPPYVKFQNFKKIKKLESEYFLKARNTQGKLVFESAQSGNFDIYLLFIEKCIDLLNSSGKMGFIAPSLWLKNEYGQSLRRKIKKNKSLEKWIDFKSFQVFSEVTTYTALQFFSKRNTDKIKFLFAHDGDISNIDWKDSYLISYDELGEADAWNLMKPEDKSILDKLNANCEPLLQYAEKIIVGIQTSADDIYQLVGKNGSYCLKNSKKNCEQIDLEDELLHPLVSGESLKKYQQPVTNVSVLFPYKVSGGKATLYEEHELCKCFPLTYAYLKKNEKVLKNRESGKMNIEGWYGYVYPKNLTKQHLPKILVPRLVENLFAVVDEAGAYYLDNVDVNAVIPKSKEDLWYLFALLNSSVCNFVFKRISKPFRGETLSANKQFIGPLPVPLVSNEVKCKISEMAKSVFYLHIDRAEIIDSINERLKCQQCTVKKKDASWLWSDIKSVDELKGIFSSNLKKSEATKLAKQTYVENINKKVNKLVSVLQNSRDVVVEEDCGKISIIVDGDPVVKVFEERSLSKFIAAQWNVVLKKYANKRSINNNSFMADFLSIYATANSSLSAQVVSSSEQLDALCKRISMAEVLLESNVFEVYKLSSAEINVIRRG